MVQFFFNPGYSAIYQHPTPARDLQCCFTWRFTAKIAIFEPPGTPGVPMSHVKKKSHAQDRPEVSFVNLKVPFRAMFKLRRGEGRCNVH